MYFYNLMVSGIWICWILFLEVHWFLVFTLSVVHCCWAFLIWWQNKCVHSTDLIFICSLLQAVSESWKIQNNLEAFWGLSVWSPNLWARIPFIVSSVAHIDTPCHSCALSSSHLWTSASFLWPTSWLPLCPYLSALQAWMLFSVGKPSLTPKYGLCLAKSPSIIPFKPLISVF